METKKLKDFTSFIASYILFEIGMILFFIFLFFINFLILYYIKNLFKISEFSAFLISEVLLFFLIINIYFKGSYYLRSRYADLKRKKIFTVIIIFNILFLLTIFFSGYNILIIPKIISGILIFLGILSYDKKIKVKKKINKKLFYLFGLILGIFIIMLIEKREKTKTSKKISKTKENITKVYKNKTLDTFCKNDNSYKLKLINRNGRFEIRLKKNKETNNWEGKYNQTEYHNGNSEITVPIIYKNKKFYDKNNGKEVQNLKGFKLYFEVEEQDESKFEITESSSSGVIGFERENQSKLSQKYIDTYFPDNRSDEFKGIGAMDDGIKLIYSEDNPYISYVEIIDSRRYTIAETCTNDNEMLEYDSYSDK